MLKGEPMFAGLANLISKHSKAVILAWLVVLIVSLGFVTKSGDVLVYDITEMSGADTESTVGYEILDEYFTNQMNLAEIIVIEYSGESELEKAQLAYVSLESTIFSETSGKSILTLRTAGADSISITSNPVLKSSC